MQFFYIQNCKMCFNKKILYQYFVFCPTWDSFSSEKIHIYFFSAVTKQH